jgi:hypothetical protein
LAVKDLRKDLEDVLKDFSLVIVLTLAHGRGKHLIYFFETEVNLNTRATMADIRRRGYISTGGLGLVEAPSNPSTIANVGERMAYGSKLSAC